ncbi:MAG: hypothetical protein P8011_16280 [Acidihalobacter sp.]|uniref:hypothetical protein n=1 Tax=Acidihalobacter sp. TaxID=1872108 RepID=UPI00307EEAE0
MRQDALKQTAIEAIFERMDSIAAQCYDKFPLFRVASASDWTLSKRGSWMGGFWAGLWWLKAAVTGRGTDRDQAAQWCTKLEAMLDEPSVNRSFVFWYGPGLGGRLHGDDDAARLARRATQAMADSFDGSLAAWPLGEGMGGGDNGRHTLNVDSLAPILSLMHTHGGRKGCIMAQWRLDACMTHLQGAAGAWRSHVVVLVPHAAEETAGAWQRGQSWAMLGLAEAARLYGQKRYIDAAVRACAYWHRQWDGSAPGNGASPVDPCALAIVSVAPLRLWQHLPDRLWLREQSYLHLEELLTKEIVETGSFVGHHYRIGPNEVQLVESPCATFFLLEALLIQAKIL